MSARPDRIDAGHMRLAPMPPWVTATDHECELDWDEMPAESTQLAFADPLNWPALVDQLSEELMHARRALAEVPGELAGTRAGERNARHQALHDGLTALPNHGHFCDQLTHVLSQASPSTEHVAVLVLDLDDFKQVNDCHGHAAGDELLCIIAARLHRAVRAEDMVSRMGGDEFACMLRGVPDQVQLRRLACKLFDAIAAPVKIGDVCLAVRPSIGIACYPRDGLTPQTLLQCADLAMYQAKRAQTGYAFCELGEA